MTHRRILLTGLCALLVYGVCAADQTAIMNSFNSGELSPRLYGRTDVKKYYSGCKTLENMFIWPHGPVTKRSGTYFVAAAAGYTTETTTTYDANGYYPVLLELDANDIPAAPAAPTITPTAPVTEVNDVNGLQAMAGAGRYYLANSIDLIGIVWTPITNFTGVFDGNDFTISNLVIDQAASSNQALFGTVGDGAEFRDVTFTDCNVTGLNYVGVLIGNHSVAGDVTIDNIQFTDCNVIGTDYVGVLMGAITGNSTYVIQDVNIEDCNLSGDDYVAFVLPVAWDTLNADIRDCNVINCTMTLTNSSAGMLLGDVDLDSTCTADINIVDCTVTGGTLTATGGDLVGGFAGYLQGRTATYSVIVHSCDSSVDVTITTTGDADSGTGAFVGSLQNLGEFTTCTSTGDLTINFTGLSKACQAVGGFVGLESSYGTYTDSYSSGNIIIDGTGLSSLQLVGGFNGKHDWSSDSSVTRCYATGNITITMHTDCSWNGIGGFVGGALGSANTGAATIERCWASGDITLSGKGEPDDSAKGGLGAFLGQIWRGGSIADNPAYSHIIQNCYAWGSIAITDLTAPDNGVGIAVSGFIGSMDRTNYGTGVSVINCYAAQTDTAAGSGYSDQIPDTETYSAGLIGYVESGYTVTDANTYWDTETSAVAFDDYADGHLTDWMQTKSNYENAGWDFDSIWYIPDDGTSSVTTTTTPIELATAVRLIGFEYSTEQAYVLALGDESMSFYKDVP